VPGSALGYSGGVLAWSGYVELDTVLDRAGQDALARRLTHYAAVVSNDDGLGRTSVSVCVEADTLRQATSQVLQVIGEATLKTETPGNPVQVRVMPWHDLEHAVSRRNVPPLAGYAEIAEMAGVADDRAREVADEDESFPQPVGIVDGGPAFLADEVEAWIEKRQRLG
jgi:predicted DNA-binding transcriptional regulator AlpA